MSADKDEFDHIFLALGERLGTDGTDLLAAFAGFLGRKTDFFTAVPQPVWEKKALNIFRTAAAKAVRVHSERKMAREEALRRLQEEQSKQRDERKKEMDERKIYDINDEEASQILEEEQERKREKVLRDAAAPVVIGEKKSEVIESVGDEADNGELGKLLPNEGNGCTLDKYIWTQTLQEIELKIPFNVPFALRARDVVVSISKKTLKMGLKGQEPVIDGELGGEVKPDESIWVIQDDKNVMVTLDKAKKMKWWDRLMSTDTPISTKKIVPEDSKISDLQDETRNVVEKMLYNQRQKELGLPTSEEQNKRKLLEAFKKQHPEMDFSRCKIEKS